MNTFNKNYNENDRMIIVHDLNLARKILSSDNFKVPNLGDFLGKVEVATGDDFTVTKRFIGVSPFFLDGPRHAELRMLAMQFFDQKNMAKWDTFIHLTITHIMDDLRDKSNIELTADIAIPIFIKLAQPMLGLYPRDPEYFFSKAMKLQQLVEPMQSLKRIKQFESDLSNLVNSLDCSATSNTPLSGAEGLPTFIEMMADSGEFDDKELSPFAITLFAAIAPLAQTAVNMIAYIYTHHTGVAPSTADFTAQFDHYLAKAIAPKYIHRTAIESIMLDSQWVEAGKTVLIDIQGLTDSASPDMACAHRMGFGFGKHFCVGAALSKKVLKTLVPSFLSQFPTLNPGDADINEENLIAHEYRYFHLHTH